MLSNMRKALDGLANKELISYRTKSGRISEGAKSYGSNKKEIEEAIKKFFNFDEKLSINDEQVIEQLDSDTLRELISMFDTYEYGSVSVQVNNRIYVIEFNIEEDDCYLKVEDYADLFNEKGIDPFIYAEPIGTLKKNKKFQQAWRNFKLGGEPKFINESNSKEINESPSINANISKANLKKLKKVLKDVYGVTEGLDISGTTLELLNKRAMKDLIDHISENEEDRVIIESDEHLYVIDYAVYEDGIYFRCTDYQTAWEESRVDPFEISRPIGKLATNKALQRAWQSVGMGEEPDLDF